MTASYQAFQFLFRSCTADLHLQCSRKSTTPAVCPLQISFLNSGFCLVQFGWVFLAGGGGGASSTAASTLLAMKLVNSAYIQEHAFSISLPRPSSNAVTTNPLTYDSPGGVSGYPRAWYRSGS